MRAVVVAEYGGPEVLRVAEVPEPEPGPGEVTISVRFAGVNFTDVRNRIGDGLGGQCRSYPVWRSRAASAAWGTGWAG